MENLFVGFVSSLLFIAKGNHAMDIQMNKDLIGIPGSTKKDMTCYFTPGEKDYVHVVGIKRIGKHSDTGYLIAAFYNPNRREKPHLTVKGQYLNGRITLFNYSEPFTTVTMRFNEIRCEDEDNYTCEVRFDTKGVGNITTSNPSRIIINSYPTIPDAILPSVQLSEVVNYQIVTFICTGNLGKPAPGKLIWRKQKDSKVLDIYYNVSTEIEEIPENCTFRGTSNLTLKITKNDQGAIVECTEETLEYNTSMWLQTKKINVKLINNGSPNTNGNNDFVVFYIILPILSILSILSVVVAVVIFNAFWKKHQNGETSINEENRNASSGHANTIDTNATNFYEILNAESDRSFHEYSTTNDHTQLHRNEGTSHETSAELYQYEHVNY